MLPDWAIIAYIHIIHKNIQNMKFRFEYRPNPSEFEPIEPRKARTFREVLVDVENGIDELAEKDPSAQYDFKDMNEIDMSLPVENNVVSRLSIGTMLVNNGFAQFADRLGARLGLTLDENGKVVSKTE